MSLSHQAEIRLHDAQLTDGMSSDAYTGHYHVSATEKHFRKRPSKINEKS